MEGPGCATAGRTAGAGMSRVVCEGFGLGSEEIKIEALKRADVRFQEISIQYSSRLGEIKLNPWRDGFYNLWFLLKKRFS